MFNFLSTIYAVNIGEKYNSPWGKDGGPSLGDLVSLVMSSGIAIAGIIVLFMFIFAGISIISGAGNNDPKAAATGKQALTYAIIGFMVVLFAYWGIRLIEVITGSTFLTDPLNRSAAGCEPYCL